MVYADQRVTDGAERYRTRKIDARLATIEDDIDNGTIGGGGGGGAPTTASYVTLGTNATLTNERVLTAGAGISLTDAGAGSTITIAATGGQAFPVGSVFIGVVSTNPATLLGYGTWSSIAAGRVLVGLDSGDTDFDTVEEAGGAKTSSHTHTYTEVVSHTHAVTITDPGHAHTQTTSATDGATTRADSSSGGTVYNNVANINSNTTGITATTANPAGSVATGTTAATAPSVVQPYFVVYMWKRTA